MKNLNKLMIGAIFCSALISGCNNGSSVTTNASQTTKLLLDSIASESEPTTPLKIFQKHALANVTQVGRFEKDISESPINPNNLDDISRIIVIGGYNIDDYSKDGELLSSLKLTDSWVGAFEFNQEEINQLDKEITPTEAFQEVLQSCSNNHAPKDIELYAYSIFHPTILVSPEVYTFQLHDKVEKDKYICRQATYFVDSGEIECMSTKVACNL